MKKSQLAEAIRSVLAEGMPNFKKPSKFETQNDTPEMTKVRKKLHAIQDRQDKFDKDKKDGKWTTERGRPIQSKITDDTKAIFAELNKLRKEADAKKKEKLDESKIRQAIKEVLAEEVEFKEGDKCLALLRGSAADGYEECTILGMDPSGVAIVQNKDGLSDEVYTKELRPIGGERSIKEEGQETVKLTADNIKYPFVDNTKNAILDKEYCDKVGIKYNLGDSFNVDGTEFQVRSIIEPYFYVLVKLGSGERNVNEEEYDIVRDIHSTLGRNASQDEVEDYLGRSLSGSELKALGFNSGKVTGYKYGQPQYAGQGQKKTYSRRY